MRLDPKRLSDNGQDLKEKLDRAIIGQARAIREVVRCMESVFAKIPPPNRPLGVYLFLGPTGVGKTECVRAIATALLGRPDAMTQIDCSEFQRSHETAKLLGAPAGYVGFAERDACRFTQEKIDKHQTLKHPINIVLFDEIEKAHPDLHDAILGMLDTGILTLGNGQRVDFTKSLIILTSNIGSRETRKLIEHSGIGFSSPSEEREDLDQKIWRMSKEAVAKEFRPEFLNRVDRLIVFHSLSAASLRAILEIELQRIQERLLDAKMFVSVALTRRAKEWLIREGTSETFGARELRRILEREITSPLASLIGSRQLVAFDGVTVDHFGGDLTFTRQPRKPQPPPEPPLLIVEGR